jgi:hypothetical protein
MERDPAARLRQGFSEPLVDVVEVSVGERDSNEARDECLRDREDREAVGRVVAVVVALDDETAVARDEETRDASQPRVHEPIRLRDRSRVELCGCGTRPFPNGRARRTLPRCVLGARTTPGGDQSDRHDRDRPRASEHPTTLGRSPSALVMPFTPTGHPRLERTIARLGQHRPENVVLGARVDDPIAIANDPVYPDVPEEPTAKPRLADARNPSSRSAPRVDGCATGSTRSRRGSSSEQRRTRPTEGCHAPERTAPAALDPTTR